MTLVGCDCGLYMRGKEAAEAEKKLANDESGKEDVNDFGMGRAAEPAACQSTVSNSDMPLDMISSWNKKQAQLILQIFACTVYQ